MIVTRDEICKRIPHSYGMCLIEIVSDWDEDSITCVSKTHILPSNPLRNKNHLPMTALIEYGAQAMAIHGSLMSKNDGNESRAGYLAGLKDVHLEKGDLSDIHNEILIVAKNIYSDGKNMIYDFFVYNGEKQLATGRATVFGAIESGGL